MKKRWTLAFVLSIAAMSVQAIYGEAALANAQDQQIVSEELSTVEPADSTDLKEVEKQPETFQAPELVSVKSNGYRSVKITWKEVPGAKSYTVYYKGNHVRKFKMLQSRITGTSFIHKSSKKYPLVTGQKYTYTVKAVLESGVSGWDAKGKTAVPKPGSARMKNAVPKSYNQVNLTWTKVSGATGYAVYYRLGSGKWEKIGLTKNTSYVFKGSAKHPIKTGAAYSYTVRAYRLVNKKKIYGRYAVNPLLAKTSPAAAKLVSAVCPEAGKIQIRWKKAAGADGYVILRKTAGNSWEQIARVPGGNVTKYTHVSSKEFPVNTGETYWYTVRSFTTEGAVWGSYNKTGRKVIATPDRFKWKEKNNVSYCYDASSDKNLTGMQQVNGKYYYFTSGGAQRVGWQKIGSAYYYFNYAKGAKGYRLSSKTINGITLRSNGKAALSSGTQEKARLLTKANTVVSSITNLNMADTQRLRKCFEYAVNQFRYRDIGNFYSGSDWDQHYARYFLDYGYGDCFAAGAGFAYLAAAAGLPNAKVVSSGGHGWAEDRSTQETVST